MVHPDILKYNEAETNTEAEKEIYKKLSTLIDRHLSEAESKVWHRHPVWFLEKNPIVGYVKQKPGIRLMFWSGASFEDERLIVRGEKFKDASIFFNSVEEIDEKLLEEWLAKSRKIQWNYRDLMKKKGKLDKMESSE